MVTTKEENEKMLEFIEHEEQTEWMNTIQSLTPIIYTLAIGSAVTDIVAKSLSEILKEEDKKL